MDGEIARQREARPLVDIDILGNVGKLAGYSCSASFLSKFPARAKICDLGDRICWLSDAE